MIIEANFTIHMEKNSLSLISKSAFILRASITLSVCVMKVTLCKLCENTCSSVIKLLFYAPTITLFMSNRRQHLEKMAAFQWMLLVAVVVVFGEQDSFYN